MVEISFTSNFNTENITDMEGMFAQSKRLIVANLSNLNTENVLNMKNMFSNCNSMKYINI